MDLIKIIAISQISLLLLSCSATTTNHSTKAILFMADEEPSRLSKNSAELSHVYRAPKNPDGFVIGGNPVYISSESKFSIRLNAIHPSWLIPGDEEAKNLSSKGYGPKNTLDRNGISKRKEGAISEKIYNHIRDKQLWLLTTISSLNTADPLETNSKTYFKATNVKFDAESFALVPLDEEERYVFTHESDASYRVKFQLFEVDDLAFKQQFARAADNPGVAGLVDDALTVIANTAGAIAGDLITQEFERWSEEDLALERLLLQAGANEEFHGELIVLRDEDFTTKYANYKVNIDWESLREPAQALLKEVRDNDKRATSNASYYEELEKIFKREDLPSEIKYPYFESQYLLVDLVKCLNNNNLLNSDPDNYEGFVQLRKAIDKAEFNYSLKSTESVVYFSGLEDDQDIDEAENEDNLEPSVESDKQLSFGFFSSEPKDRTFFSEEDQSPSCSNKQLSDYGFIQFSVSETQALKLYTNGTSFETPQSLAETLQTILKVEEFITRAVSGDTLAQKQQQKAELEQQLYRAAIDKGILDQRRALAEDEIARLRSEQNAQVRNDASENIHDELTAFQNLIDDQNIKLADILAKLSDYSQNISELTAQIQTLTEEIRSTDGYIDALETSDQQAITVARQSLEQITRDFNDWTTHLNRSND